MPFVLCEQISKGIRFRCSLNDSLEAQDSEPKHRNIGKHSNFRVGRNKYIKNVGSKKKRNNNQQQVEFIMIGKRSVIILGMIFVFSGFSIITSIGIFAGASLIFIGIYLILKVMS